MGWDLINTLTWWQWAVLGLVPPAIVLLYFLKLKRRPVEVPSTYLWLRSIEDLHVNAVWQRLRRNLLLFLQLLVLFLVILALMRPGWRGTRLLGHRFIFLVDNSASMQATDVAPSRLEEAKRQARRLVDQMQSGDVGMVVSFADGAHVEQMFTDSRPQLRRALEGIGPTARTTSLGEALRVAAGLANPGRSGDVQESRDIHVAEALPATVYLFSDGKFDDVGGFALGNLQVVFQPIGRADSGNVGVLNLSVGRNEAHPSRLQAFARLQNSSSGPTSVNLELWRTADGPAGPATEMVNSLQVPLAAEESKGVAMDVGEIDSGVVELRAGTQDPLPLDDRAWAVVNPPRRAKVLVVTPGSEPLHFALGTRSSSELADVTFDDPAYLATEAYNQAADAGRFDLVIYDRCRPKRMPQANTLAIGPPAPEGWKARPAVQVPQIIDADRSHPLMQYVDLGDVLLAEATPLEGPPGTKVLVDSSAGPLVAIAPRENFEDAVLGFVLVDQRRDAAGKTGPFVGTNWYVRSFPVFIYNMLNYLGLSRTAALGAVNVRPGQPVTIETPVGDPPRVRTPSGGEIRLTEGKQGKDTFAATSELGVYEVRTRGNSVRRFAVNLFQATESDIRPRKEIKIGNVAVAGQAATVSARREMWRFLLLAGLAVLLVEWYIYGRRVYL
jgi:hypothetical protein